MANEEAQIEALQDQIKHLQSQAAELNGNMTNLDAVSADILDLQVKAELAEKNYVNATTQAESARIESSMQALNNANISILDHPKPPVRERQKTPKMMGIAAASGVLGGLRWAFLLELYVDHTVKRPKEIEGELGHAPVPFDSLHEWQEASEIFGWREEKSKTCEPAQNGHTRARRRSMATPTWKSPRGMRSIRCINITRHCATG